MTDRQPKENPASEADRASAGLDPLAGLLAWVLPGLGHIVAGRRARGFGVMAGVLGLFLGGLLIGGITVVDSRSERTETRLSYFGMLFVGPVVIVVDRFHQSNFKGVDPMRPPHAARRHALPHETIENGAIRSAGPGEAPPVRRSVGKVNEIGVLYCLIAGMLNFIAILDVLLPPGKPSSQGGKGRPKDAPRRTSVLDTMASGRAPAGGEL